MAHPQPLPPSAREYVAAQRREAQAAAAAAARLWARMGDDFDATYAGIADQLEGVATIAQTRMASSAQAFIPAVLEDTGQSGSIPAYATAQITPLIGVDGSGRPVESLLYGAVTHAKSRVDAGLAYRAALYSSRSWLTTALGTLLSDTARQSEALGIGVRKTGGYVRMLVPPTCDRCVVLAGAHYSSKQAFLRHPKCDCRHIPASEAVASDLTVSPNAYFDSLSADAQDATFGQAGAEAIRAGADVSQVVNAKRGMTVSQVGGQRIATTTEGTTRRGIARRRMGSSQTAPVRPMPETIATIATDRDEYLRLLRRYGYVL